MKEKEFDESQAGGKLGSEDVTPFTEIEKIEIPCELNKKEEDYQ